MTSHITAHDAVKRFPTDSEYSVQTKAFQDLALLLIGSMKDQVSLGYALDGLQTAKFWTLRGLRTKD